MIDPRTEADLLVQFVGSPQKAFEVLERQFGILVIRSQALLMSSAAVLVVAAWAGRSVAPNGASRLLVLVSLGLVLAGAAAISFGRSIPVTWITEQLETDSAKFLTNCIQLRRQRTGYLKIGTMLFVAGFVALVGGLALPLLSSAS